MAVLRDLDSEGNVWEDGGIETTASTKVDTIVGVAMFAGGKDCSFWGESDTSKASKDFDLGYREREIGSGGV